MTSSSQHPRFAVLDGLADELLRVALWDGRRPRDSAPHAHVHGQVFGASRGLLTVGTDTGSWVVPASHAVWIPAHCSHQVRSHGDFHGWSAFVDANAGSILPPVPQVVRSSGLLREAILRLGGESDGRSSSIRRRIAQVALDELAALPHEALGLPLPRSAGLLRVARALLADPGDTRDQQAWAAIAAVSARTLLRRFVAETGLGFDEWRQRVRLLHAIEQLAVDVPVNRVALDLGYHHASAFIALFRRHFGVTPRQWIGRAGTVNTLSGSAPYRGVGHAVDIQGGGEDAL